jgi:hypothetical protein
MDLVTAWRQAQLAELVWDTPEGPDATVVVPMTDEGVACIALSYDQLARAEALTTAGSAVATISDPILGRGADLLRVRVGVTRDGDLSAERFEDSKLILQELAKHPPSRRRIDSILLRREHAWFLPRLLLHLEPLEDPEPLHPTGALLAHRSGRGLEVTSVRVTQRRDDRLELGLEATTDGTQAARSGSTSGPAVLLEHGAEPPDLERRWTFRRYGRLEGATLVVSREESWGRTDRSPTLMQRIRDERALERACREGLRIAKV